MTEIWRPIKGYEGLYEVSNKGRVKSLERYSVKFGHQKELVDEKPISLHKSSAGYMVVHLSKDGERKSKSVHRLVAQAFIPNPQGLPFINHKDEDPTNNHVDNLEWCTQKYNVNYGTRNERASKSISKAMKGKYIGSKSPNARKIVCITTGEIFNSMTQAAEKYNIAYQDISKCCRKKRKSAGKHQVTGEKLLWEYYKEGEII